MRRSIAWCACVLLSGCFLENASSGKQLTEAVTEMNKAARWGQVALAAQMVVPMYRQQFLENHAHWGKSVQLADSEIVHIEMQPGAESALAVVAYEWYMTQTMTLHQSVVRQRWSREGEGFALISEVVVSGDGRLLSPDGDPPKVAPMRDPMVGSAD